MLSTDISSRGTLGYVLAARKMEVEESRIGSGIRCNLGWSQGLYVGSQYLDRYF